MNAIDATAWAIFMFEGGNKHDPTTRNVRNNNPGNLRPYAHVQPADAGGYRVFTFLVDGWTALVGDIGYKVAHHLQPEGTMVDFFNLYAPGADHNDPAGYAQFVVGWLSKALNKAVTIDSRIGDIYGSSAS